MQQRRKREKVAPRAGLVRLKRRLRRSRKTPRRKVERVLPSALERPEPAAAQARFVLPSSPELARDVPHVCTYTYLSFDPADEMCYRFLCQPGSIRITPLVTPQETGPHMRLSAQPPASTRLSSHLRPKPIRSRMSLPCDQTLSATPSVFNALQKSAQQSQNNGFQVPAFSHSSALFRCKSRSFNTFAKTYPGYICASRSAPWRAG
jgi:hypothetical protein